MDTLQALRTKVFIRLPAHLHPYSGSSYSPMVNEALGNAVANPSLLGHALTARTKNPFKGGDERKSFYMVDHETLKNFEDLSKATRLSLNECFILALESRTIFNGVQ